MTTLLEAAKTLIKVLELEKSQIVLSMTSGRALEQLEQAIAQELASQSASTKPVVSQETAGTVDKDCGNCKKFSTNSLTGGPVCISCKDYSNWEPKP